LRTLEQDLNGHSQSPSARTIVAQAAHKSLENALDEIPAATLSGGAAGLLLIGAENRRPFGAFSVVISIDAPAGLIRPGGLRFAAV
jgi:hypothetical protein